MSRVSYILLFAISNIFLLSLSQEEKRFNPGCPSFSCGSLGKIGFPFPNRTHPECGLCRVDDCGKPIQRIQLGKQGQWFYASTISMDNTVVLHYQNAFGSRTCGFINLSLPISALLSFEVPHHPTIFKCPLSYSFPTYLAVVCNNSKHLFLHYPSRVKLPSSLSQCSRIPFLVNKTQKSVELVNLSTVRFALKVNVTKECYDCYLAGGQCQTDRHGKFNCSITKRAGTTNYSNYWGWLHTSPVSGGLCQTDGKGKFKCSEAERTSDGKSGLKLSIGLSISGTGILIVLAFFFFRKLSQPLSMLFGNKRSKDYQNIEAFLRNYGSLAPKRYSYSDIKKMTNSFRHKLGQGGYEVVYKGMLFDGYCVAIKVLTESRGNGEEFINEIASINRTLIYEFMSNRSLEKFIHEKGSLKWETLYQIVVGIARGLKYLHRGCNTRILHFDIKPHNILLNEDYCPKISDFGLVKICLKKESIVSMTGAQGTIGYITPKVFSRNFGIVSDKSDVYSFGMMVLEITRRRHNNNVQVDNSSESYFSQWIYERLKEDEELGLHDISNEDDKESIRKMIIVSLWCIQTNPSERPTMSRVLEVLKGSLYSLSIPPKPFLYSPRSDLRDSSISLPG